jgi:hypothetical protein
MSNEELYEDDFDNEYETDPIKQLRKANKAKEKQLKEIQEELSNLRKEKRERTISEVLTARGLNPAIAEFIPQDIDLTEESLSAWVEAKSSIFGAAPAQQTQTPTGLPEGFIDNYNKAQSTVDQSIPADRQRVIEQQMAEASAKGPDALKQLFTDLGKAGY